MKTIIIDDEPNALELLTILVTRHCPNLQIIGTFHDPQDALVSIRQLKPELVFLDIEMPRMNGFDLLNKLPTTSFHVIFTTAYDKHALKAFKYNAIGYLLKPIDQDDLIKTVEKALNRRLELQQSQYDILNQYSASQGKNEVTKVALPSSNGMFFVNPLDIIHCDSDGNYTTVYVKDRKPLILSKSLGKVVETLKDTLGEENCFFRIHNSHLINLKHVFSFISGEPGKVEMSNNNQLPVSRAQKKTLLEELGKY
jgi:two-component system, LytTR family, response regulator